MDQLATKPGWTDIMFLVNETEDGNSPGKRVYTHIYSTRGTGKKLEKLMGEKVLNAIKKYLYANEKAAEKCQAKIPQKARRVPWESVTLIQKRKHVNNLRKEVNETGNEKVMTQHSQAKKELSEQYKLKQKIYITEKVKEIQEATNNQQASKAWQIVNEISGRKCLKKSLPTLPKKDSTAGSHTSHPYLDNHQIS
eukprot:gene1286-1418_t